MLTGSGKRDGRFGTAIAALGDINFDSYNGTLFLKSKQVTVHPKKSPRLIFTFCRLLFLGIYFKIRHICFYFPLSECQFTIT